MRQCKLEKYFILKIPGESFYMKKCIFCLLIIFGTPLGACEKSDSVPEPASAPSNGVPEQTDTHISHSPACSNLELAEIFDSLTLADQLNVEVDACSARCVAGILHKSLYENSNKSKVMNSRG